MYRKLLIATDGSQLAGKAVEQGINLAKETNASIVFVTVTAMWSPSEMTGEVTSGRVNPMQHYEDSVAAAAKKVLDAAVKKAEGAGLKAEGVHVADEGTAQGVVETAEKRGCDLILMATHGRRGLNRLLLGSETTEVLHLSKVPVLVVR